MSDPTLLHSTVSRLASPLPIIAMVLAAITVQTSAAADFYVSPQGNDRFSGKSPQTNAEKTDGPLATIHAATERVRLLRRQEPNRQRPIIVMLRGGRYELSHPLVLGPEDSGTKKSPVIYRAYAKERPVLSGGRRITDWRVTDDGRWHTQVADTDGESWAFSQFFVDDQRRFRPRLPKQGYYHIAGEAAPSPKAEGKGHDRFVYNEGELEPEWAHRTDVEVMAFHQWSASRMQIASINSEKRLVTFAGNTLSSGWWGKYIKGHRYRVVNVKESLSEPGEWYLDRNSGKITYIPRQGEMPQTTTAVAPRLERLLVLVGNGKQNQWAQHIRFEGLTFAHTNWILPASGQAFPQAEIGLGAAISAIAARHVVFDRCVVRHTGGYAMAFGAGCRHNQIENCELVDLGAGGIKIGMASPGSWSDSRQLPQGPEAIVSHHTVRNCLIAHGGRLHPAAIGVWIGHSPHNTIEHNDIHDFYYTALSVGWTWGYAHSHAHHNDIGFNHAYNIGQGVLSDMGAIYTLGVSPGTVIHDNHFHDVRSFDYGGWGLYTDEGSTGIVMKNNLVYRCTRGSFHQHYGKENRIENNILAFAEHQQIQRTRTEPHTSFFFERNIVFWDNDSPLLGSNWKDNNFQMDRNLYYHARGREITFPGNLTFKQWQTERKQDRNSRIADPRFVDALRGDFRLPEDTPARQLGFVPFDYSRAGRQSGSQLTAHLPPVPGGFE